MGLKLITFVILLSILKTSQSIQQYLLKKYQSKWKIILNIQKEDYSPMASTTST